MRADAFGPAAVTGLAWQGPRRSLHRDDATGAALIRTAGTEIRRLRAGLRDKARRALSPPVLGSRCGVNCPEGQFNITGCCAHARRSLASSLGAGHARNPRYVLRPSAPARASARSTKPMPAQYRSMCGHGFAVTARAHGQAPQAAQSSSWPRPSTHPPPRGSPALSTVLAQRSAVLAASRPSPCGARERGLDPAARGAP